MLCRPRAGVGDLSYECASVLESCQHFCLWTSIRRPALEGDQQWLVQLQLEGKSRQRETTAHQQMDQDIYPV
eukprot:scaffold38339_cov18-Tisochrysis_lutea.AAC.2